MSNEVWTEMDELGFKIGNQDGEWQRGKPLKREQNKSKPVRRKRKQEAEKKHIRRTGRK